MIWLLLFVTIVSMLICYSVARSRAADHVFWVIMGLLLGPFAIPFVFFSKPKGD